MDSFFRWASIINHAENHKAIDTLDITDISKTSVSNSM